MLYGRGRGLMYSGYLVVLWKGVVVVGAVRYRFNLWEIIYQLIYLPATRLFNAIVWYDS